MKEQTLASELLADFKKQNKRIFIALIVVLIMWFSTIGLFIYYIQNTAYEDDYTTELNTDNSGSGNGSIKIDGDVINGTN